MGPVVTVVSDDLALRSGVEEGLRSRGFEILPLPEGEDWSRPPLARKPSALLLDATVDPYGATELAEQLRAWLDARCPALVCLGEPAEPAPEGVFDARVTCGEGLVAELAQLLPRLTAASGVALRGDVRDALDDEAAGQ